MSCANEGLCNNSPPDRNTTVPSCANLLQKQIELQQVFARSSVTAISKSRQNVPEHDLNVSLRKLISHVSAP